MDEQKFVIKLDSWGEYTYYSSHGHFAGKDNAMSYTTKNKARHFNTKEEALKYISDYFPQWTKKDKYIVEELTNYDLILMYQTIQ